MLTIDSHEVLTLSFQHSFSRVIKPAINKISVDTVTIANLKRSC
jgi:hypothetical protein